MMMFTFYLSKNDDDNNVFDITSALATREENQQIWICI